MVDKRADAIETSTSTTTTYGTRVKTGPNTNLLRMNPHTDTTTGTTQEVKYGMKDHIGTAIELAQVLKGPLELNSAESPLYFEGACDCKGNVKVNKIYLMQGTILIIPRHRMGMFHTFYNRSDYEVEIEAVVLERTDNEYDLIKLRETALTYQGIYPNSIVIA